MRVREVMTTDVLNVARRDTFEAAARRMTEGRVLSALVDGDPASPGIVTARDVLELVAEGRDAKTTAVAERFTPEATAAGPSWTLERTAEAMIEGGFRHLVVAEAGTTVGVVSIRDIVAVWMKQRVWRRTIQIREAMNTSFPSFSGDETVEQAARQMARQEIGAAIVQRKPKTRPLIVTERDMLELVAKGLDPGVERLADHLAKRMTYSAPDWSLKQAAEAMVKGHFQNVVVVARNETVGIISMRDVLRRWLD